MSRGRASHLPAARGYRRCAIPLVSLILASAAFAPAAGAASVRDLPGLSGRSVQVVTAAPSPDGEVTVVANVRTGGASSERIRVVRLRADGAPQIGFGRWGVAGLSGRARALGAVTNPSTGRVYVAAISAGRPVLFALGDDGRPDPEFGSAGRLRVEGQASPGSFRLAAVPSYLFLTLGSGSCAGCTVRELSLPSGQLVTSSTLSRDQVAGRAGCAQARIGDLGVLAGRLVLAAEACGHLLVDIPQPHRSDGTTLRGSRFPLASGSRQAALRTDTGQDRACLAVRESGGTRLSGAGYAGLSALAGSGSRSQLDSAVRDVVAFGSAGCAALASLTRPASILVSTRPGSLRLRRVSGLTRADALAAPGGGLLVLGVKRSGGREQARLAVVSR